MLDITKAFVLKQFETYYKSAKLELPTGWQSREWGFIPMDGTMMRHKEFTSEAVLREYLASMRIMHAYHSVAYYRLPGAQTMAGKDWQGADVVFDIDADPEHMPKCAGKPYPEQLLIAKKETKKLLDVLIGELGLGDYGLKLVFSGGRGYHVHLTDPRVHQMNSAARRELVDYFTGVGFNPDVLKVEKQLQTSVSLAKAARTWQIQDYNKGSLWSKRVAQYIYDVLTEVAGGDLSLAKKYELTRTKKEKLIRFAGNEANRERVLHEGRLRLGDTGLNEFFHQLLTTEADLITGTYGVEFDEAVTTDIKRLIRLPGSLHGKTGLRVTVLSMDQFDRFDPLTDAVAFDDQPVNVIVTRPMTVELQDNVYTISEGVGELPLNVAMYMFLQGAAELHV